MDSTTVLDLFRTSGALPEGHFRLTSGLHSERSLQSALVLQYPDLATRLGDAIGERTRHLQPTVVLSPALGGIVIGQEVGRALGVRAIFAERQDGRLTLRRGFTVSPSDPRTSSPPAARRARRSRSRTSRARTWSAPRRSSIADRTPRASLCRSSASCRWRSRPITRSRVRSARRGSRSSSPDHARRSGLSSSVVMRILERGAWLARRDD